MRPFTRRSRWQRLSSWGRGVRRDSAPRLRSLRSVGRNIGLAAGALTGVAAGSAAVTSLRERAG